MATYKKGYKKLNAETVLLRVIIGIIISVFVFVVSAFIYDALTKWENYNYFTAVTEYDGIFELTNEEETALDNYVVYFYTDTCDNCKEIKRDVLFDGYKINKDGDIFFVADAAAMTDETAQLDAFLDTIDKTSMGTPLLIVVADGEFYDYYSGSDLILNTLESIKDGTFEPFIS